MSDEEDDYMSDKFLFTGAQDESQMPKALREKRLHDIHKKQIKQRAEQVPLHVKEKRVLEEGMETALNSDNKGFQMLAKMGYKQGSGLGKESSGIKEPIKVSIKLDKRSVGADGAGPSKRRKENNDVDQAEFRKMLRERSTFKLFHSQLIKAKKACEHFDTLAGLEDPPMKIFYIKVKESTSTDYTSDEEELDELDDLQDLLAFISDYLRKKYKYCTFCAITGEEDLEKHCPGTRMEDHDL